MSLICMTFKGYAKKVWKEMNAEWNMPAKDKLAGSAGFSTAMGISVGLLAELSTLGNGLVFGAEAAGFSLGGSLVYHAVGKAVTEIKKLKRN